MRDFRPYTGIFRGITYLLTLLQVVACTPTVAPGNLTPVRFRTSNAVIAADLQVMDGWDSRLTIAKTRSVRETVAGSHDYQVASASAWMGFAKDEYSADPSGPTAEAAFERAREMVQAMERDSVAIEPAEAVVTPVAGTRQVREDLWERISHLKVDPNFAMVATDVADLEVALVRAGRTRDTSHPSCQATTQLMRAERLIARVEGKLIELRPLPVLAVAPVARDSTPIPAPRPADVPKDRPVMISVHFALDKDALSDHSRKKLNAVADALKSHPKLSVVIEGHADPRGKAGHNMSLSRRRAERVKDYLASLGLDSTRANLTAFGSAQRAAGGRSMLDYALDRRVTVQFMTNGGAMTEEMRPRDLQIEDVRTGGDVERIRPTKAKHTSNNKSQKGKGAVK